MWQGNLNMCSICVGNALPPVSISNAPRDPTGLANYTEIVRSYYCQQFRTSTEWFLNELGLVVTSEFQSPVEFFSMTQLTAPIPDPGAARRSLDSLRLWGGSGVPTVWTREGISIVFSSKLDFQHYLDLPGNMRGWDSESFCRGCYYNGVLAENAASTRGDIFL